MKRLFTDVLPIAVLVTVLVIVFWPLLTGSIFLHTGVVYSDLMLFNYPLKDWYRSQLLSGSLPFWTSLLGNGFPVFAEMQIGALYPMHLLLFRLLPTLAAFNINLFLHFLFAGVFTYWFARVSLKLSKPAALLAGLSYSLSGFFVTHMHQINILLVISYLPLALLFTERLASTRRLVWGFALVPVFALQVLAGYIEMHYYTLIIVLIFYVVVEFFLPQESKRKTLSSWKTALMLVLSIALAAGVSAAQILPTMELTGFSQRAEGLGIESASATVWPLETFSMFVNPTAYDLFRTEPGYHPAISQTVNIQALYGYIGIVPLVLALSAVVVARRQRYAVVFVGLLIAALVYGLGRSTQLFTILWETLPGLKFFRFPVKILFFVDFCLAVLAGFGMDGLRERLVRHNQRLRHQSSAFRAKLSFLFIALVLAAAFGDLYWNNVKRIRIEVAGDEWFQTPQVATLLRDRLEDGMYRFYTHGTNNIDYQLTRKVEMQRQFQNLLPVDFNLLTRLPSNREWFALLLQRQQALNQERTILNPETGVLGLSETFKKSLALQSVRYLVADLPIEDPDLVPVETVPFSQTVDHYAYFAGPEGPRTVPVPAKAAHVYEYRNAVPRARVVPTARQVAGEEEALAAVLSADFDPTREVVLEEQVNKIEHGGSGVASILSDRENQLDVQVALNGPGYLVLNDTYYPGWTATIDGVDTEIYRANYAFRAVPVPAGEHTVRFRFEPTHWRMGLFISIVSLIVTAGGFVYALFGKR